MIQILKPGTKNRIECNYCGALLSYDKEDIKHEEMHFGPMDFAIKNYIVCPQCKTKVVLEATR